MNYNTEIIEEHDKWGNTRCNQCDRRVKEEDLGYNITYPGGWEHPEEGTYHCPLCLKETELYKESIEQYIEAEGYDIKDCIE